MGVKWNPFTGELDLVGSGSSADTTTLKTTILNSIVTHTGESPLVRDNLPIGTAFITIDNNGNVIFT